MIAKVAYEHNFIYPHFEEDTFIPSEGWLRKQAREVCEASVAMRKLTLEEKRLRRGQALIVVVMLILEQEHCVVNAFEALKMKKGKNVYKVMLALCGYSRNRNKTDFFQEADPEINRLTYEQVRRRVLELMKLSNGRQKSDFITIQDAADINDQVSQQEEMELWELLCPGGLLDATVSPDIFDVDGAGDKNLGVGHGKPSEEEATSSQRDKSDEENGQEKGTSDAEMSNDDEESDTDDDSDGDDADEETHKFVYLRKLS